MIEELNAAIAEYQQKWEALVEGRKNKPFFAALRPTAVAWKTVDAAEYGTIMAELRELSDTIVENWWDGRWIAMLHLRDSRLTAGIKIVKLMQRRPGSTDATGIDHIDFYSPRVAEAEDILAREPGLTWSNEQGGLTTWISVWFDGTEAKLRTHTIIDSCIRDLRATNKKIRSGEKIA